MSRYEKLLLTGIFFSIISVFFTWHSFMYSYYSPGLIGEAVGPGISGYVMGYNLVAGRAVIICGAVMLVLTLVPKDRGRVERFLMAQLIFGGFILFFFISGGLAPIIKDYGVSPQPGLLCLFIGCILLFWGLWRGFSEYRD